MRNRLASILMLLSGVMIASCSTKAARDSASAVAERDIRTIWSAYEAAGESSDIAGFLAITTEDFALSSPGMPTVRGHAALQRFLGDAFKALRYSDVSLTLGDLVIAGDRASQFGSYRETYSASPAAAPTTDYGQFAALLRRGPDGKWRIASQLAAKDSSVGASAN